MAAIASVELSALTDWVAQSGVVRSVGSENGGAWEVVHRNFDPFGLQIKFPQEDDGTKPEFLGDISATHLLDAPIFYAGGEWDDHAELYVLGGRFYDPFSGRWVTDGGGENGYKFSDNNPTRDRILGVTETVEGNYDVGILPEFINRGIGEGTRTVFGDENLAQSSDLSLFLGTTSIAAGTVLSGYGVLYAFGIVGGTAAATAAASTSTAGATLSAAGSVLTYASLGFSGARVAFTGNGTGDLLSDSTSLLADVVATRTTGLFRAGALAVDFGLNLFQGGRSAVQSYDAFRRGDYLGGTLNAVGASLGFASAGIRGGQLNALRAPNSAVPQVTLNRIQGEVGAAAVRQRLLGSRSVDLVGEQVRVRTHGVGSHRVTDFLVRGKNTGRLRVIEVKTGRATRDATQLAKDALIADPLAPTTFFGRRARAAGFPNGTPTGPIRTFEVNASNLNR